MALTFFEEQLNNVHIQPRGFGQRDAIGSRGAWGRLADAERRSLANRYDLGYWRVTVEHRDRLAPAYRAQILAEPGLQFSNADLLHGYIMTINSHLAKQPDSSRPSSAADTIGSWLTSSPVPTRSTRPMHSSPAIGPSIAATSRSCASSNPVERPVRVVGSPREAVTPLCRGGRSTARGESPGEHRPSTLREPQGRPEQGRGATSSGRPEPVEGRDW